eukprot:3626629-Pyramimonas_sp.AAC.1
MGILSDNELYETLATLDIEVKESCVMGFPFAIAWSLAVESTEMSSDHVICIQLVTNAPKLSLELYWISLCNIRCLGLGLKH